MSIVNKITPNNTGLNPFPITSKTKASHFCEAFVYYKNLNKVDYS